MSEERDSLEARLYELARREWPTLEVDRGVFAAYVVTRCVVSTLEDARVADLYLACACVLGAPGAAEAFERAYRRDLQLALSRVDVHGHDRDDVLQMLRERLLVGAHDEPPLIGQYGGRGSLGGWLRIVATRSALKIDRGERRREGREAAERDAGLGIVELDPELVHLKQLYVREFREAFDAALRGLNDRSKALLRQSIVQKLTVRQIAAFYDVHHATAARWINMARDELIQRTHAALAERLAIDDRSMEDILALIRSSVDLTVSRLLGP